MISNNMQKFQARKIYFKPKRVSKNVFHSI